MRIVYTIADLQPESGGPTRSVSALAAAVAERGFEVQVMTLEYGKHAGAPILPKPPVQVILAPCRGTLARRGKFSPAFSKTLLESCRTGSETVLHDNGLWLPTNHAAARVASMAQVPFVVSPRGMLTLWSLRFRGWKKRLAWWLYQRRDLQAAQVLHATSKGEGEGFRALGLTQPVAVVPNGVALPPGLPSPTSQLSTLNPLPSRRTALFLGRIHPIKGLLNLVEAWAVLRPAGWQVVLAGQNENNHQAEIESAIHRHQLQSDFRFVGPVDASSKWDLYRSADLFILPSYTENFGLAVAEALACGLPVLTTRGTPWEELVSCRCGWWVEIGAEALAHALREALALNGTERREMGRRGRKLVEGQYTWPAAAQKMTSVYRWMLGQGERPECVSVLR